MPKCRKCGKGPKEIGGYLKRVNVLGQPGQWECRPGCDIQMSDDDKVLASLRPEWAPDPGWPPEQRLKVIDLLATVAYRHMDAGQRGLAGNALFAIRELATETPEQLEEALRGLILEIGDAA